MNCTVNLNTWHHFIVVIVNLCFYSTKQLILKLRTVSKFFKDDIYHILKNNNKCEYEDDVLHFFKKLTFQQKIIYVESNDQINKHGFLSVIKMIKSDSQVLNFIDYIPGIKEFFVPNHKINKVNDINIHKSCCCILYYLNNVHDNVTLTNFYLFVLEKINNYAAKNILTKYEYIYVGVKYKNMFGKINSDYYSVDDLICQKKLMIIMFGTIKLTKTKIDMGNVYPYLCKIFKSDCIIDGHADVIFNFLSIPKFILFDKITIEEYIYLYLMTTAAYEGIHRDTIYRLYIQNYPGVFYVLCEMYLSKEENNGVTELIVKLKNKIVCDTNKIRKIIESHRVSYIFRNKLSYIVSSRSENLLDFFVQNEIMNAKNINCIRKDFFSVRYDKNLK